MRSLIPWSRRALGALVCTFLRPGIYVWLLVAIIAAGIAISIASPVTVTEQETFNICTAHHAGPPSKSTRNEASAKDCPSDPTVSETFSVGVASPSLTSPLWGPGQLYEFGRQVPTRPQFAGWARPSLGLDSYQLVPTPRHHSQFSTLVHSMVWAWTLVFLNCLWKAEVGAICLLLGLFGLHSLANRLGWVRPLPLTRMVWGLVSVSILAAVVIGAGFGITAASAPGTLGDIHGIADVFGRVAMPKHTAPVSGAVYNDEVVGLGDSTGAGAGLPPFTSSRADRDCSRSPDSYLADLAAANPGLGVLNLDCSGATIQTGILTPEYPGRTWIPAQIDSAAQVKGVKLFILSVGADDVGWSTLLKECAKAAFCNDPVTQRLYEHSLDQLEREQTTLYSKLVLWPGQPKVIVVLYYNPFGKNLNCLAGTGLTASKVQVLTDRLTELNNEIASSAETFGFWVAKINFSAQPLCSPSSFVQGLTGRAPFHPSITGAWAQESQVQKVIEQADPLLLTPAAALGG